MFVEKNTNYDVAKQFCKNQGAHLFEPKSEPTNKLVFDKSFEAFGGEYKSWIGINDLAIEGEYVFTSSGEKVSSFFWSSGNTFGGAEDCVLVGYPGYKEEWFDRPCSGLAYSICEFGKYKFYSTRAGMPQDMD